jgi:hypothetical protein
MSDRYDIQQDERDVEIAAQKLVRYWRKRVRQVSHARPANEDVAAEKYDERMALVRTGRSRVVTKLVTAENERGLASSVSSHF